MNINRLTQTLGVFLLGCTFGLIGCGQTPEQAASSSMSQLEQAYSQYQRELENRDFETTSMMANVHGAARQLFVDQVKAIDISGTPRGFQDAWGIFRLELKEAIDIPHGDPYAEAIRKKRVESAMEKLMDVARQYDPAAADMNR